VNLRGFTGRRKAAPRIGMFGLFGSSNIGNDGSLEALLNYLKAAHPDAVLNVLCPGPERIRASYGVGGTPLWWHTKYAGQTSGLAAIPLKAVSKGIDVLRTAAWVRRHDVVMVPGTGILETTLPLRPWQTPYSLFLVCAFSRIFGTKVALVSVGASVTSKPASRWLIVSAARLACYRSYRDQQSWDAMKQSGVDTARDPVYPDLAFALPVPADTQDGQPTVGVGLMDYRGGNDDRSRAEDLHDAYVAKMKVFVRWLVDGGRRVRVFAGDDVDSSVVQEVVADLRAARPDLESECVVAEPVSSLHELMRQIAAVDIVVATRYHNVLCALKLAKPTLSTGYAAKNVVLMTEMGLSGFCQNAGSLDVDQLIEQFTELENRSAELRQAIAERTRACAQRLDEQFSLLSELLLGGAKSAEPVPELAQPT
jgi:polysaccharide pyruvyl transferase WcaK-like protein